jgi:outer membrane receptor protein involved in Fe transport
MVVAQGRPAGAQPSALEGVVQSAQTGQPIVNAVISIEGSAASAVTNGAGRFRFPAAPSGPVALSVQAPGFLGRRVPDARASAAPLVIALDVTPNFLERIQVTATKTSLSVGDIASQADIIDRGAIDARGDQTLTQAIAHVPGVLVSGQAGSFESAMLRGLPREGNEFTNTLLLIDGVPQVDSRNSARMVALPITDASSIEVVRGPNSALYGRTAIGGSINVRTADPSPVHQLRADFVGGQFDTLKGFAAASGPVSSWGGYYASIEKEVLFTTSVVLR